MINKHKLLDCKRFSVLIAAGAFTVVPQLSGTAAAQEDGAVGGAGQNLGQQIGDAISGQVGPAANNAQGAVERGVRRAGQGLLQGQNVGEAVRQGVGEGVRSSVETPAQIQNRNLYEQQQSFYGGQAAGQQTFSPQYYRDANGQMFYLNNQGARVYGQNQFSGGARVQSPAGQFYGSSQVQQGQSNSQAWSNSQASNGQRKLGVNVTGQADGVRIDQVVDGTVAAQTELQQGDVITQIDGTAVRTVSDVVSALNRPSAKSDIQLTVMRDGEEQTLTASFNQQGAQQNGYQSARPSMPGAAGNANSGSLQQQIAELRNEIAELRKQVKAMQPEGDASAGLSGDVEQEADILQSDLGEESLDVDANAGAGTDTPVTDAPEENPQG